MASSLLEIAGSISTPVEKRLFAEYGAVLTTTATPPPAIIFTNAAEVEAFQASLNVDRANFGGHEITLQAAALEALSSAASRMREQGGSLTARAADAGARSYGDTVRLWTRNVTRGFEHWVNAGRITAERARSISNLPPAEQVAAILNLEDTEHLFFGTFSDRSILYSVAAPGASQHLSMLAFDVAEYEDRAVDLMLRSLGWFRTVPHDLPHFTYLGHSEENLPGLGLKLITHSHAQRVYDFWTPDLERLF
jgi:hypothetical protein